VAILRPSLWAKDGCGKTLAGGLRVPLGGLIEQRICENSIWFRRDFGVIIRYTIPERTGITMASVKTAISIQRSLFDEVERLASEMNVSRSRIFSMAVEDFLQRYQNQRLLAELNQAYGSDLTMEEQKNMEEMRQQQRRVVDEW
jgi:predicted transcriptional regulator